MLAGVSHLFCKCDNIERRLRCLCRLLTAHLASAACNCHYNGVSLLHAGVPSHSIHHCPSLTHVHSRASFSWGHELAVSHGRHLCACESTSKIVSETSAQSDIDELVSLQPSSNLPSITPRSFLKRTRSRSRKSTAVQHTSPDDLAAAEPDNWELHSTLPSSLVSEYDAAEAAAAAAPAADEAPPQSAHSRGSRAPALPNDAAASTSRAQPLQSYHRGYGSVAGGAADQRQAGTFEAQLLAKVRSIQGLSDAFPDASSPGGGQASARSKVRGGSHVTEQDLERNTAPASAGRAQDSGSSRRQAARGARRQQQPRRARRAGGAAASNTDSEHNVDARACVGAQPARRQRLSPGPLPAPKPMALMSLPSETRRMRLFEEHYGDTMPELIERKAAAAATSEQDGQARAWFVRGMHISQKHRKLGILVRNRPAIRQRAALSQAADIQERSRQLPNHTQKADLIGASARDSEEPLAQLPAEVQVRRGTSGPIA